MYYDFLVKIPVNTGKITKNKRKNATYIEYTYDRKYIPEKKYNVAMRTTIGKMDPSDPTMMYPNPNFEKYFPEVALPNTEEDSFRSSCIHVGAFLVIEKIIDDYKLQDYLSCWDERGKGLLLDLAAYSIICQDNAAQCYSDYVYNHPLFTLNNKIYTDSTISRILSEINEDDRIIFLDNWNEKRNHREMIYISNDSTNKFCKAGDIEMAEYSHSKEAVEDEDPLINYAIAYDIENEEPLLYESYPGGNLDVSRQKYILENLKEHGYKKVGFILDRGYFSRDMIAFMDKGRYDFMIMVNGQGSFVNQHILDKKGTFETKRSCYIDGYETYGITIQSKLYDEDEADRWFHLYHNIWLESDERIQLEDNLRHMEELMEKYIGAEITFSKKYVHYYELTYQKKKGRQIFCGYKEKSNVIERELKLCGYYAIITSKEMKAKDALILYKSRDTSEEMFCCGKSFLDNHTLRVSGIDTFEGNAFVAFVALIIRCKIYTQLRKKKAEMIRHANFMTVPAALRELEKIELIRQPGGNYKLDHAITATQKTILEAFGIDEVEAKTRALAIGKELMNAEKPESEMEDEYGLLAFDEFDW